MSERKYPTIQSERLVDEFRAVADRCGLHIADEISECGYFLDLEWEPNDGLDGMLARRARDPAFTVTGWTQLVFARICGEIRCYASPLVLGDWYWSGADPKRRAALDAEPQVHGCAVLNDVEEAVRLTTDYLAGVALESLHARRVMANKIG